MQSCHCAGSNESVKLPKRPQMLDKRLASNASGVKKRQTCMHSGQVHSSQTAERRNLETCASGAHRSLVPADSPGSVRDAIQYSFSPYVSLRRGWHGLLVANAGLIIENTQPMQLPSASNIHKE